MPWKKGQSGNSAGRPKKGTDLAGLLREQLAAVDKHTRKNNAQRIVSALIAKAVDGDLKAIREVLDRILGPASSIEPESGQVDLRDFVAEAEERAAERRRTRPADRPPG